MPAGVQVFDEAARLVYDDTTDVGRISKTILINSPNAGSYTDPDLLPDNRFHMLMSPHNDIIVDVTISGNTVYWSDARRYFEGPFPQPIDDYTAVLKYGNY